MTPMKFFKIALTALGLMSAVSSLPAAADCISGPLCPTATVSVTPLPSSLTSDFPTGTWGIIGQGSVNWMSSNVGQGSFFSSDPELEGTVDSNSNITEDVNLTSMIVAGPECGLSCDGLNLTLDGLWSTSNDVTSSLVGVGSGTVDVPFIVGTRAQTAGGIGLDFGFDYTFGDDVVIPEVTP